MSRSYKKPFVTLCDAGVMKDWKRLCNQSMRRMAKEEEIPNGRYYKRFNDVWGSPSDGKRYWDEPRYRRK